MAEIAAEANASRSHVNTLFRKSMGMPLHQYVIQRKVERAKELLMNDNLAMAEIASAVGFAHQSHMARHLRRVYGASPRELRRLLAAASDGNKQSQSRGTSQLRRPDR